MNLLLITGIIHFKPVYDHFKGKRVVRLTIKTIDKRFEPQMATIINCQWKDPPDSYWQSERMAIGTMIYAEGPLHQSPSKNDESILNRTPYLEILFFSIIKTKEDFEAMRRRVTEKAEKARKK